MRWYGSDKKRYRIQRRISLVLVVVALVVLAEGLACGASFEELKKPVTVLAIGGVMFYFANKW